jgi:zinc and cadmium transporter
VFLAFGLNTKTESITKIFIPFAAGNFIYIAGSDLIPELHKEVGIRKNILQFLVLVCGIGVMLLLLQVG